MKTTREFLAAIKQQHNLKTDGDLHRFLGVSRERISRYQKGHDYFGEETALQVAAALDLSPGYVLACIAAERTRSERVRKEWEKLAGRAAVLALAVLAVYGINADQEAALAFMVAASPIANSVYYVKLSNSEI